MQTSASVEQLEEGASPFESGGLDEGSNGNGSLMRVAPLALWHQGTDAELAEGAHLQSLPTHGHPRSQAACALLSLALRKILGGTAAPDEALDAAAESLVVHYAGRPTFATELEGLLQAPQRRAPRGTGYVVDTLWSAMHAVRDRDFEAALRAAIAFGNDTDTTACVAGAIAGALHGVEAIPARWLQALRGKEIVEPLAARLVEEA
jgi:ADP-ribosylglycohydrolase